MRLEMVLIFLGRFVASWYSRRREFGADRLAAQITDPSYMKSALLRLQEISEGRVNLKKEKIGLLQQPLFYYFSILSIAAILLSKLG